MIELSNGMWLQVVFCNQPKETEHDKILLEYTKILNLQKSWSVITAQKVENKTYPTDKWGVVLLRED